MAWNTTHNKEATAPSSKQLPVGAPIATNPAYTGKGYSDSWSIERAYQEGMRKVTWVFRCIDAIAGNQARLPMVLRDDNSPEGKIIKDDDILKILNSRANMGEDSFIFRFRLSAQMLMSTRGVFVEVIRGRNGKPVSLHLLPPQYTAPIPDPKTFVSGYEVVLPTGDRQRLRPEQVIWLRKPHPLDPYRSLTPMEAAGMAIEIENLAKLYNRNFLLNDGRPGGLLVVKGDMEQDDIDELRSRFRGDMSRTGQISVLASEDGADYTDFGSNPREASYMEMRNITKEEILSAFGVPETVIGNAAGRTFSNAAEEIRIFWMETMLPHLEPIARGLDVLDEKYYVAFNTESVPILILAKQEREKYLLEELRTGAITYNEYREGTGRKVVKAELSDALLANPNLTPIGNTKKEMKLEDPQAPPVGAAVPPGEIPGTAPASGAPELPTEEPLPPGEDIQQASHPMGIEVKQWGDPEDWEQKSGEASDRWEEILDRALERFFERQQRVVFEKLNGKKSHAALEAGTLTVGSLFDIDTWNRQLAEDLRPILAGAALEAAAFIAEKSGREVDQRDPLIQESLDGQVARIQQINRTTSEEIAIATLAAMSLVGSEDRHTMLKAGIAAIFVKALSNRRKRIAEVESQVALNSGIFYAGKQIGATTKTWITRKDDRVRSTHRPMEGKRVNLDENFHIDGFALRFPGDPLAPGRLSIGCRCRLRFD